jgi:hypothetical protein
MRLTIAALGLGVLAAFAAGCGSSGSSGTPNSGGTASNNNPFQAYLSCLQQNGVTITLPSGGPGRGAPSGAPGSIPSGAPVFPSGAPGSFPSGGVPGGGIFQKPANVSQETWDKAQSACASLRPSLGPGGGPGGGGDNGAATAYRNCLADHGVAVTAGQVNTADPKFAEADKACAVLRPSARPSAG